MTVPKFKIGANLIRTYGKDEMLRTSCVTVKEIQGKYYACTWYSDKGDLCCAIVLEKELSEE